MSDEQFPPAPGGMVDTARKAAAAQTELATTAETVDGPVPYSAVRVRTEPPDLGTARTVTLGAANPVLRLLSQDPQRRTAVVIAIDADVYISGSRDAASAAAGTGTAEGCFYLPAGIGIPVDNQAAFWVAATDTTISTRVSVLVSKDAAP